MNENLEKTNIWIDADSCPSLVRNHCVKMAAKLNLQIFFVANKQINCDENFPYKMIICEEKKDSADDYIFFHAKQNDLVITRDINFAFRLVQKNICAINDRGTVFSKENINELLSKSDFDLQLSQIGLIKHFNEGYDKKKFSLFANCFDKIIHRLMIYK